MYILKSLKILFLLAWCVFAQYTFAQSDTITVQNTVVPAIIKNKKWQWYPACRDTITNQLWLRNEQACFGRKFLRAEGMVLGIQSTTLGLLFVLPGKISNWEKSDIRNYRDNYKSTFTKRPVLDDDHWYINYLGHPYQGAYYYNALRSQGAPFWQAGLFSFGQSMVWEYLLEGGIEQPSIQDMMVTPILGSLLGELFHFSSVKMANNGYTWYEKAFVAVFNPMFAINNGFRFAKQPNPNLVTAAP